MKDQHVPTSMHSKPDNQSSLVQRWLADTASLTPANSLRILIVLSQQPTQTGSGVYVRELVEELQKLGHDPYLLAAHYRPLSRADFPFLPDSHIYTMIFDNGENTDIAEIKFPIPGMSLDMPYLHLPFRELSPSMLQQYCDAWIAKLQTIVEKINPQILHINHLWLMAHIARSATSWLPIVSTTHGSEFILLQDSPRFLSLIRSGVQSLDSVIAISMDTARDAVEIFGLHPDQVHIIGNGYNPKLFHIMHREPGETALATVLSGYQNLPSWDKLVLYVGKFAHYKALPYLIRAARYYSYDTQNNVITLIIGEGSREVRSHLENIVETLGLREKILLPGKVPYEKVGPIMNIADVFVLPSINEGFGLVLLEALACGVRCVAANRGGPRFFVPQILQEKGLVSLVEPLGLLEDQQADPNDEERYVIDLASAISLQLRSSTTAIQRQAIADSVKYLTWASRIKETTQVYLSAIQRRREIIVKGS